MGGLYWCLTGPSTATQPNFQHFCLAGRMADIDQVKARCILPRIALKMPASEAHDLRWFASLIQTAGPREKGAREERPF
jgi:hypothetical protein